MSVGGSFEERGLSPSVMAQLIYCLFSLSLSSRYLYGLSSCLRWSFRRQLSPIPSPRRLPIRDKQTFQQKFLTAGESLTVKSRRLGHKSQDYNDRVRYRLQSIGRFEWERCFREVRHNFIQYFSFPASYNVDCNRCCRNYPKRDYYIV